MQALNSQFDHEASSDPSIQRLRDVRHCVAEVRHQENTETPTDRHKCGRHSRTQSPRSREFFHTKKKLVNPGTAQRCFGGSRRNRAEEATEEARAMSLQVRPNQSQSPKYRESSAALGGEVFLFQLCGGTTRGITPGTIWAAHQLNSPRYRAKYFQCTKVVYDSES